MKSARLFASLFAVTLPAAMSLPAAADHAAPLNARTFVAEATAANLLDVETSALAFERAENDAVRSFAQDVVQEGNIADEKLEEIAGAAATSLPTVDPKHYEKLDGLSAKEGEGFDAAYLDLQAEVYENAVTLFSTYAERGDDQELKAFAAETLPTLEERLQEIREIERSM